MDAVSFGFWVFKQDPKGEGGSKSKMEGGWEGGEALQRYTPQSFK